jgi:hypothetical protein
MIVSNPRLPGDPWAEAMESELRELVHEKYGNKPVTFRVFCNSIGCLCYVDQHRPPDDRFGLLFKLPIYQELHGERGKRLGIEVRDVNSAWYYSYGQQVAWELTIVRHPASDPHGKQTSEFPP